MYLLDASAILAYFFRESGYEELEPYLSKKVLVSTINWLEVVNRVRKVSSAEAEKELEIMREQFMILTSFNELDMQKTLSLHFPAELRISLADRACLGTAIARKMPVVTADRTWQKLKLPTEVICIR